MPDDTAVTSPDVEVTTTEAEAAPAEQTAEETTEETSEKTEITQGEESGRPKHIPYERFSEVNEAKKKAEYESLRLQVELDQLRKQHAEKPQQEVPEEDKQAIEALRRMGFVTKDEAVKIAKEAEEKITRQSRQETILKELETTYNGAEGAPKFIRDEALAEARKVLSDDKTLLEAAFWYAKRNELIDSAAKKAKRPAVTSTKATPADRAIGDGLDRDISVAQKTRSWKDVIKKVIDTD